MICMKALVNVYIIGAIAVVLISAVVFTSGRSIVDNMVEDKEYFEAKLTLLRIRDNMVLASTLDSGQIKFTSFGSKGTYRITIDEEFISLAKFDEEGNAINMPPVAPYPHYTPEAIRSAAAPPYIIEVPAASDICIIKRQNVPACGPEVEVCEYAANGCSCPPHSLCK